MFQLHCYKMTKGIQSKSSWLRRVLWEHNRFQRFSTTKRPNKVTGYRSPKSKKWISVDFLPLCMHLFDMKTRRAIFHYKVSMMIIPALWRLSNHYDQNLFFNFGCFLFLFTFDAPLFSRNLSIIEITQLLCILLMRICLIQKLFSLISVVFRF